MVWSILYENARDKTNHMFTIQLYSPMDFHLLQEPTLGDMLEYIEAQNKALDEEGKEPPTDSTTSDMFMSGIKFNGVSILPPVVRLSASFYCGLDRLSLFY